VFIVVVVLCVLLSSYVYLFYYVCIAVFTLDAGLLARSQYSEGLATGHLDTGFSWFPCVYKQMLRWFPTFQVAATCFSCSPPDLNLLVNNLTFCIHVKYPGAQNIVKDIKQYQKKWQQHVQRMDTNRLPKQHYNINQKDEGT